MRRPPTVTPPACGNVTTATRPAQWDLDESAHGTSSRTAPHGTLHEGGAELVTGRLLDPHTGGRLQRTPAGNDVNPRHTIQRSSTRRRGQNSLTGDRLWRTFRPSVTLRRRLRAAPQSMPRLRPGRIGPVARSSGTGSCAPRRDAAHNACRPRAARQANRGRAIRHPSLRSTYSPTAIDGPSSGNDELSWSTTASSQRSTQLESVRQSRSMRRTAGLNGTDTRIRGVTGLA